MSSEEQADAYLEEAKLTLASAQAIFQTAEKSGDELWAQVVKNGYDAIEQAVSAGIAAEDEAIPRNHPGKINTFIELYAPRKEIEEILLHWLQRRSSSQYVDIRGDRLNIPHEQFTREDASQILDDVEIVLRYVEDQLN
jgi:HEPN domain-containing protein